MSDERLFLQAAFYFPIIYTERILHMEETDMAFRPTVKLTRHQIYDEVWSSAVSGMALKYNIPYSAMLKQIKDAGIPIPPPGYWTKKEFDKETTITELTGDPNEIISLYKTSAAANKMWNTTPNEPIQESKAPSNRKHPKSTPLRQSHPTQMKKLIWESPR